MNTVDASTTTPVLPPGDGHAPGRQLQEYVRVLTRRWWIVALVTVAVVGGSWWRQRGQLPQYQSTAVVQRSSYEGDFLTGGYAAWLASDPAQLATQVRIIQTHGVLAPAADSLGMRFQVNDPVYRRFDVIERAYVAPTAPPGAYRLARTPAGLGLVDPATGRTLATARNGVLEGPGFRLVLNPEFVPEEPVAVVILLPEEAIGRLAGGVNPYLDRSSVLINIEYTSPDPLLAARAAQQIAEQYRWHAGGERRRKAQETLAIAQSRLGELKEEMSEQTLGTGTRSADLLFEQSSTALRVAQADVQQHRSLSRILGEALREYEETERLATLTALAGTVTGIDFLFDRLAEQQEIRQAAVSKDGPEHRSVQVADSIIGILRGQIEGQVRQTLRVVDAQEQDAVQEVARLVGQQQALIPGMQSAEQADMQVGALLTQYRTLLERENQAIIEAAVEGSPVEIVQPAVVPTTPLPQRRTRTLLLSLVMGLALGVIAALLLEQLDTRVRDPEDVQRSAGIGVIGLIPALRETETGRPLPLSQAEQQTVGAEAFRKLRTNLRFVRAERPQVVAVTSASPHEGKSVLSANLALALVQQRSRVLLIDADLRRPVQHTIFGLKRDPGLSDVLVGILPPTQAIRKDVQVPGLYVMPCGTEPPNPSELLGSEEFVKLLVQMRKHFDTIIVDTPPVHLVSDAAIVSTVVDGTLVVVDAGRTDRHVLAGAVNELRQARATLLGVVLNRVDARGSYGYGYGRYSRSGYYRTPSGSNGDREWKETLDSLWKQVSPYV